jgi:hypothetical protein
MRKNSSIDIRKQQSELENNVLYLEYVKFSNIFNSKELTNMDFKNLLDISKIIAKKSIFVENKGLNDYSNEFYRIVSKINLLIKNNKDINKEKLKNFICRIFTSYWQIFALYDFKKTLKPFYDKLTLNNNFNIKIDSAKEDFNELHNEFKDNYTIKDLYANNKYLLDLIDKVTLDKN